MTSCTFAGHREVFQAGIDADIHRAVEDLLKTDTVFRFYTGGMGEFDSKCAAAVRAAKRTHPELDIRVILALPYMSNRVNTEKLYYEYLYDEIFIPEELAGVHYKAAIGKRNRLIVEMSDWLICFVYRDFGGAATTLRYAQKQGKQIINLAEGIK